MLNIFKLWVKNYNLDNNYNKGNQIAQIKHYVPADKEWFNSVYAYNKNTIKLQPVADKVILKLLKSYFNLYSPALERNVRFPRLRRWLRRLSTNRMLVSRAELKHTSDKVIITVYVYNRQKTYYIRKLFRIADAIAYTDGEDSFIKQKMKSLKVLKNVKKKSLMILSKVYKQKKKLLKTLGKKNNKNKFKSYEKQYLKNFLIKCFRREMLLMYYKQIISLNKSKFDKTYLLPLTSIIRNVYKKKIEFNLVNLEYLYLNSYIFSETLVTKIRKKKNRLLRVLKASLRMFHLAPLDKLSILSDMYNRKKLLQNLKVNYSEPLFRRLRREIISDKINKSLQLIYKKKSLDSVGNNVHTIHTTKNILDSIKHKSVTGIRIEAAGRLTRRNTAEKSVFKLKYKGNLKNMDSSYKGISTILLRGHAKSNVQYTKLKSKLRIGSFGLKGWVSSN